MDSALENKMWTSEFHKWLVDSSIPVGLASNIQESKERVPQMTSDFPTTCGFDFKNENQELKFTKALTQLMDS